jgi:hypothetical protein
MRLRRLLWLPALLAVLAGCTAPRLGSAQVQDAPGNPAALPRRTVTNFTEGLRCMDDLMLRFGVHDISVMLEEMEDKTGKLGGGARDMMVSAISDMTRRSRAIKLIAFGVDNQNIVDFLTNLGKQNRFSLVPQYDIRGGLTRFDTDAERRKAGFGVSFLSLLGFRIGRESAVDVLGFDASVIQTSDLSLVHGVSSKNTIVIVREESGLGEGKASIQKVGITFDSIVGRQDSPSTAMRNMIELATIELVGRLVKVPYWTCLGIDANNTEVKREIEDWFVGLRKAADINAFMQDQLRNREFYDGPVDGRTSEALRKAIVEYGRGIGAKSEGRVDLAYFTDFLQKAPPSPPAEPFSNADRNPDKLGELKLELATAGDVRHGQPLELKVKSSADAYVYCYSQAETGKIQRFFPNRFARDPRVAADDTLVLPGKLEFALRANASGTSHKLACLSAAREVYGGLPPPLRWSDFEDIGFTSFDDIRQAFANAAKTPINMAEVSVKLPEPAPNPNALPGGIELPRFTPPRLPRLPTQPKGQIGVPTPSPGK